MAIDLEHSDSTADFQNFLIELSNDPKIDLLSLSRKAIEDGQDVFRVMSLLRESCHKIDIRNPNHILDLLSSFNSKIDKSDLASGIFFPAMRSLGESRPELASEIFDTIVSEKNGELFGYLISIILGIIQFDFESGYKKSHNTMEK